MIQAGDITYCSNPGFENDPQLGYGGESTLSAPFENENQIDIDSNFYLVMATDENKSQFFINTFPSPHLSGKHTVFGKVLFGKSTVRTIEYTSVNDKSIPTVPILIENCGIWTEDLGTPVYNVSNSTIAGDIYEEYPDDDDHFDKEEPQKSYNVCEIIKNSGTELFKLKNFKESYFKFKKSLRYVNELIPDKDSSLELNLKFEALKKKLYLNLSLNLNNLNDFKNSINYSNYLLEYPDLAELDKAKAYYRRGFAYLQLKNLNQSLSDFKNCSDLNPNDKIVKSKIELVENLINEKKLKEKQNYSKFFK